MGKKMYFISILLLIFFITTNSVYAYVGSWTSSKKKDYNGISSVETTYTGYAGDAITVTLIVKYGTGDNVGRKVVGCTIDQKVSHTCVGEPFRDRYGVVQVPSTAAHLPSFDE